MNILPEAEIIIIIGQTATDSLNQSALSPPSSFCDFPAQQEATNVGAVQRKVSPAWLESLLPSTRISRPNIPLHESEQNTKCLYHHLTAHGQICPTTAGHRTCPPRLPNISCTYTETARSTNPLTRSGREGEFLQNGT